MQNIKCYPLDSVHPAFVRPLLDAIPNRSLFLCVSHTVCANHFLNKRSSHWNSLASLACGVSSSSIDSQRTDHSILLMEED